MKNIKQTPIALVVLSAVLAGCGGSKDNPPQLELAANASVKERRNLTISATATDDKSISRYEWSQISGPTLTLAQTNSATVAVTAPSIDADATAQLKLTVTDSAGQTADKTISIAITNNKLPTVTAENATGIEKSTVALKAVASDNDGSVSSYQWTQTAGPAVVLSAANTATPSFAAPSVTANTQLTFNVKVTDDDNDVVNATATVNVTQQLVSYSVSGQAPASSFANANVIASIAGNSFNGKADAQGVFTVKLQQDDDAAAPSFGHVKVVSSAITGLENYAFVSDFVAEGKVAGFAANAASKLIVSELTTARFALTQQANDGKTPTDLAALALLEKRIDPDELLEATAVSRIVANKNRELPQGVTLLQLLTNNNTYRNFIAAAEQAEPGLIKKQIDAVLADTGLMPTITTKDIPSVYYQTWASADGIFPYRGNQFYFNTDGTGYRMTDSMPQDVFNWQIADGAIDMAFTNSFEVQSFPVVNEELATRLGTTVSTLSRLGISQIRTRSKDVKISFKLVQSGRDYSVFRQVLETSNTIDPINAGGQVFTALPLIRKTVSNVLLKNGDTMPALKFTNDEVVGKSFNIAHYHPMSDTNRVSPIFTVPVIPVNAVRMDLMNFKADGTGSALIGNSVFNWVIDNKGNLVILHADGDRTEVKKIEKSSMMTQVVTRNFMANKADPIENVYWFIQYDPASLGGLKIANASDSYWQSMVNSWQKNCWVANKYYTRCGSTTFSQFFGFQFFENFIFINHSTGEDGITRIAQDPKVWRKGPNNTIEFVRTNGGVYDRSLRVYLPLKLESVGGKRRLWVIESQVSGTPTQGYTDQIAPRINFFDELPLNTPDAPSANDEQPRLVIAPSAVMSNAD